MLQNSKQQYRVASTAYVLAIASSQNFGIFLRMKIQNKSSLLTLVSYVSLKG
jgi:hypothetical protein